MADETLITPTAPVVEQKPNPVEERITDLSSKVKLASEERDAALAKVDAAEKKAAFAEGFVGIVGEFPAAMEHKAEIEAKVIAGYSPKDAAFAVLGATGKLGSPQVTRTPVAGGSAVTPITMPVSKDLGTMSREETRAALLEEIRKGNIA